MLQRVKSRGSYIHRVIRTVEHRTAPINPAARHNRKQQHPHSATCISAAWSTLLLLSAQHTERETKSIHDALILLDFVIFFNIPGGRMPHTECRYELDIVNYCSNAISIILHKS